MAVYNRVLLVRLRLISLFGSLIFAFHQPLLHLVGEHFIAIHVQQISLIVASTFEISLVGRHDEPAVTFITTVDKSAKLVVGVEFVLLRLHESLLSHVTPLLLALSNFAVTNAVAISVKKIPFLIAQGL